MRTTISKLQELAASNINSLLARAENPAKMLGLLRSELEESIIAVQGELSLSRRKADRQRAEAARLTHSAEDWSGKAVLAMQHGREDLARSALLVREQESAQAAQVLAEADALDKSALALAATMAQLEAKLAEMRGVAPSAGPDTATVPGGAERIMDRIDQLERRLGFAEMDRAEARPEAVEAEIERLARETRVDEALAELKRQAAPTKRKAK